MIAPAPAAGAPTAVVEPPRSAAHRPASSAPAAEASAPPPRVVPLASADEIHRYLRAAFRIGNRARLRFARLLAALAASRRYLELGHPSITQYAEICFGLSRSETFESLRVAEIIDALPACREAFEAGELSWSALKLITRVASAETEAAWLEFAAERRYGELRAEVQDALKKHRDRPRHDRYGLPNVTVRFTVELTREEQERLETALEKVGAEIAPALGEPRLEPKAVLLYLVERFLRTDPEGTPAGRTERDDSPYVIVYQQCPACGQARLMTADGPVEVPRARVECVAHDAAAAVVEAAAAPAAGGTPEAEAGAEAAWNGVRPRSRVQDHGHGGRSPTGTGSDPVPASAAIDRPNSPALARRVKLRDGIRCQNPGCGQRGPLHAHHIEHRARGGRTLAENEVAVCTTCHALIHAGLLEVTGDPFTGLGWRPRSRGLAVDAAEDRDALAAVPTVVIESGIPDSSPPKSAALAADDVDALAGALVRLGVPKKQARARVEWAAQSLATSGQSLDEGKVLSLAIAGA